MNSKLLFLVAISLIPAFVNAFEVPAVNLNCPFASMIVINKTVNMYSKGQFNSDLVATQYAIIDIDLEVGGDHTGPDEQLDLYYEVACGDEPQSAGSGMFFKGKYNEQKNTTLFHYSDDFLIRKEDSRRCFARVVILGENWTWIREAEECKKALCLCAVQGVSGYYESESFPVLTISEYITKKQAEFTEKQINDSNFFALISGILLVIGTALGAGITIFGNKYLQRESQKTELIIKRSIEVLNPLYQEAEINLNLLKRNEDFELNSYVWNEKIKDYLFMASDDKLKNTIASYYEKIDVYNGFLKEFREEVKHKISKKVLSYFDKITRKTPTIVEAGVIIELEKKYEQQIEYRIRKIMNILFKNNKIPSDVGELYSLGYVIEEIFKLFLDLKPKSLIHLAVSGNQIEQNKEYVQSEWKKFSKNVFNQLFKLRTLKKIKVMRKRLIKDSEDIEKYLFSKISEVKLK